MGTFQVLLLGLSVTIFQVTEGLPPGFTPAQWFIEQHVQHPKTNASNDNVYCNNEMRRVNRHLNLCKSFNSFLNDSINNVEQVCFQPNIPCKNVTLTNCHRSTTAVPITDCILTSRAFPNCRYRGRFKQSNFVVACIRPWPADHTTLSVLPTHLDST